MATTTEARQSRFWNVISVVLVLLAMSQVSVVGYRLISTSNAGPQFLEEGDRLEQLAGSVGGSNRRLTLSTNGVKWTALLVFHSACPHCETVAPKWREWLNVSHDVEIVAVTRDPDSTAEAYRDRHGWQVDVLSLGEPPEGTPEYLITGRTPWLFLVDPKGKIRFTGHGQLVDTLETVMYELAVDES